HGPEPAAVHGRVDAAGERGLPGEAEPADRLPAFQVLRRIQALDRQIGDGRELLPSLRSLTEGGTQGGLLPVPPGARGHRGGPAAVFRLHVSPLSGSPWRSPAAESPRCPRRSR